MDARSRPPGLRDKKTTRTAQRLDTINKVQQAERTLTRINGIPDHAPRITNREDWETLGTPLCSNRLVQGAFTARTIARNQQRPDLLTSLPHGNVWCICGQFNILKFNKFKCKSRC